MDDIITKIERTEIDNKLSEINNLHPSLTFTIEREENSTLPFLDMKIIHNKRHLSSTWYNKPTDTGLIMNYHALAPKKYKRSVVSGFGYRIYRACTSWELFHSSLEKAKQVLERNQYPPNFYDPIIKDTINKIIEEQQSQHQKKDNSNIEDNNQTRKIPLLIQYRGKCTEEYPTALHRTNAPCTIIMTQEIKNNPAIPQTTC